MKDILRYKKIVEENADLIEAKEEEIYNATRQWLMLDTKETQTKSNLDDLSNISYTEYIAETTELQASHEELQARQLQRHREERDRLAQERLAEESAERWRNRIRIERVESSRGIRRAVRLSAIAIIGAVMLLISTPILLPGLMIQVVTDKVNYSSRLSLWLDKVFIQPIFGPA